MTYELAQKLKDAGYPQVGMFTIHSKGYWDKGLLKHDSLVSPTLSELIAALNLFNEFSLEQHSNDWRAGVYKPSLKYPDGLCYSGKTPEEAVAQLWLHLNKQN